jgi:hypothetical protein
MGADRVNDGTDANAETVEEQPDRPPPPPPDKPGTDGYPSRADSRNGAAAANDTSTHDIDQQAERKPDTVQEPQKISGGQGSTATEKSESPRTLESDEGASNESAGERYDNPQEVPGTRPDTGQPPDEFGDPKDAGRREEAPDGRTAPHDGTTPSETEEQAVVEGQAETADKPQPNPTDQALPAIDAKGNVDQPSDGLPELAEPGKASDGDTTAPDRTLGERLTVDGKPLREHLDPVGAAAWSSDTGDQPGDPDDRKGDRIAKSEKDESSRPEKLRRKFHREGTDAVEDAGKAASHVKDILSRPPAGHMETRTGPTATPAPHDGASVTDTFTALVAAGIMVGEASRVVHKKIIQKKGT